MRINHFEHCYITAEDDFSLILDEVAAMKAEYYQLGIALGLRPSKMKVIQKQYPSDVQQAFNDMLYAWLRWEHNHEQHGPPTWRNLVKAVDKFNHALAMTIAQKHPLVGKNSSSIWIICLRLQDGVH